MDEFEKLTNGQKLDALALCLSEMTGRNLTEIRLGFVRRWAVKLAPVVASENAAVGTLLDIAVLAPDSHRDWSPLSAIDTMVDTFVRHADPATAASAPNSKT